MYGTVLQCDTMFFGSTAFIDAEMFNTLLPIRTMLVLVNAYSRWFRPGKVIVLGGLRPGVWVHGFFRGLMSGHPLTMGMAFPHVPTRMTPTVMY